MKKFIPTVPALFPARRPLAEPLFLQHFVPPPVQHRRC
jgi:hypothetical protein